MAGEQTQLHLPSQEGESDLSLRGREANLILTGELHDLHSTSTLSHGTLATVAPFPLSEHTRTAENTYNPRELNVFDPSNHDIRVQKDQDTIPHSTNATAGYGNTRYTDYRTTVDLNDQGHIPHNHTTVTTDSPKTSHRNNGPKQYSSPYPTVVQPLDAKPSTEQHTLPQSHASARNSGNPSPIKALIGHSAHTLLSNARPLSSNIYGGQGVHHRYNNSSAARNAYPTSNIAYGGHGGYLVPTPYTHANNTYPAPLGRPLDSNAGYIASSTTTYGNGADYPSSFNQPYGTFGGYPSSSNHAHGSGNGYPSSSNYGYGGDISYPSFSNDAYGIYTEYPSSLNHAYGNNNGFHASTSYAFGGNGGYPPSTSYTYGDDRHNAMASHVYGDSSGQHVPSQSVYGHNQTPINASHSTVAQRHADPPSLSNPYTTFPPPSKRPHETAFGHENTFNLGNFRSQSHISPQTSGPVHSSQDCKADARAHRLHKEILNSSTSAADYHTRLEKKYSVDEDAKTPRRPPKPSSPATPAEDLDIAGSSVDGEHDDEAVRDSDYTLDTAEPLILDESGRPSAIGKVVSIPSYPGAQYFPYASGRGLIVAPNDTNLYVHPRRRVDHDDTDFTSYIAEQRTYTEDMLPRFMGLIHVRPDEKEREPTFLRDEKGRIVRNQWGQMVKEFPFLPLRISRELEEWALCYYIALGASPGDVLDRMSPPPRNIVGDQDVDWNNIKSIKYNYSRLRSKLAMRAKRWYRRYKLQFCSKNEQTGLDAVYIRDIHKDLFKSGVIHPLQLLCRTSWDLRFDEASNSWIMFRDNAEYNAPKPMECGDTLKRILHMLQWRVPTINDLRVLSAWYRQDPQHNPWMTNPDWVNITPPPNAFKQKLINEEFLEKKRSRDAQKKASRRAGRVRKDRKKADPKVKTSAPAESRPAQTGAADSGASDEVGARVYDPAAVCLEGPLWLSFPFLRTHHQDSPREARVQAPNVNLDATVGHQSWVDQPPYGGAIWRWEGSGTQLMTGEPAANRARQGTSPDHQLVLQ
ncbi:hypothetical protein EJ05DRAFT_518546 [Pseudovirgaria hyperparasitica]|uniref:Uncharacterized protein n=1 Tax=Pseudovirgaria hyperparasitica TaxID=470096 RepID=A0A6A6W2Z6_9PEZI|nr:uncharacterized protein EJ05DRAFT_518546 [Pseudovirgaria hyperparasitica]KAF2755957.1 hypothetical protein EJ05DRAFT_518546 [Pseudovirgaria hyperparasitica]